MTDAAGRRQPPPSLRAQMLSLLASEAAAADPAADADRQRDPLALRRQLRQRLDQLRQARVGNPLANPVLQLALETARRLEDGDLALENLENLADALVGSSFAWRAESMRRYLGETDCDANQQTIRALFVSLTRERRQLRPFAEFKKLLERAAVGVVLTGHPTFALDGGKLRALASLAAGRDDDGQPMTPAARRRLLRLALSRRVHPPPSLEEESALAVSALLGLRSALRRIYAIAFEVALEAYGQPALSLNPRLLTVASWVGYDIDGRSDITWGHSFHVRLAARERCLTLYGDEIRRLLAAGDSSGDSSKNDPLNRALAAIASRLADDAARTARHARAFAAFADPPPAAGRERAVAALASASRSLAADRQRAVSRESLTALINKAIEQALASRRPATARSLAVLRAEVANFGLALSHIHVRLNASQLHNAVRGLTGMTGSPDDPGRRHTWLRAMNEKLASVQPASVHFGSLFAESASARRMFMVMAQILKHVDGDTPIRLLIAECETPFTVLAALYFARLFGVESRVEITPLFETAHALARGPAIMNALLDNRHYRAYVESHGRIWVEVGYSDSGRYLGQPAAALSIENLHMRLARSLESRGLSALRLVVFDTHGESVGRGGHPASMADRLAYLASPWSRALFGRLGLSSKEEISFQGGDGFAWFMHDHLALASLARILEYSLGQKSLSELNDPFYDSPDAGIEATALIRQFNERVMEDEGYGDLLALFAGGLFAPSGSRAASRQSEGVGGDQATLRPAQWRAIPQNAILQQMALLANVLGGVGALVRLEGDSCRRLAARSPRFRRIMKLAAHAHALSDEDVFEAYLQSVSPSLWLAGARWGSDAGRESRRAVADLLESRGASARLQRLARLLRREYDDFSAWLRQPGDDGAPAVYDLLASPLAADDVRDDLVLMHTVRIAVIHAYYLLLPRAPVFIPQQGWTHDSMMAALVSLNAGPAVAALRRIFPRSPPLESSADFGESASYRSSTLEGYDRAHREVFDMLERLHALCRRLGEGVSCVASAVG